MRAKLWGLLLGIWGGSGAAHAQVVFSEIQPNPIGSDHAEWFELHNLNPQAVNITGWNLHDGPFATAQRYAFPSASHLAAGQVIVIAKNANDYNLLATSTGWPPPDYELATTSDDPNVPNLTARGGSVFALNNMNDILVLTDPGGALLDAVEYGIDNLSLPGAAYPNAPSSGASLARIQWRPPSAASSDLDFALQVVPNPGVGFSGPRSNLPTLSNPQRLPAFFTHTATYTVSVNASDSAGVSQVDFWLTAASSGTGTALSDYSVMPMIGLQSPYRFTSVLGGTMPVSFHESYIRYYFQATNTLGFENTAPHGAGSNRANPNYYWENILPPTQVFSLSETRAQNLMQVPLWMHHTVRVQGVALTRTSAFTSGQTDFFIADPAVGITDAIHIYDPELIPLTIQPGDVVIVTGRIGLQNGLRQVGHDQRPGFPGVLGPDTHVTIVASAPVPIKTRTINTLLSDGEIYEAQLVDILHAQLVPGPGGQPVPSNWPSNDNVFAHDGTGMITVRIDGNTNLPGNPTPTGPFTLRGIFSQFALTSTGGYQIMPRGGPDIVIGIPPPDAGFFDAGSYIDGGIVDRDTGLMPTDAESASPDTGVIALRDTGISPTDATSGSGDDAETDEPDASPENGRDAEIADSQVSHQDSGPSHDGGVAFSDASIPAPDSGQQSRAGGALQEDGCGCQSTQSVRPVRQTSAKSWGLGLLLIWWGWRRRRSI